MPHGSLKPQAWGKYSLTEQHRHRCNQFDLYHFWHFSYRSFRKKATDVFRFRWLHYFPFFGCRSLYSRMERNGRAHFSVFVHSITCNWPRCRYLGVHFRGIPESSEGIRSGVRELNALGTCGHYSVLSAVSFYQNWSRPRFCLFCLYDVLATTVRQIYDARDKRGIVRGIEQKTKHGERAFLKPDNQPLTDYSCGMSCEYNKIHVDYRINIKFD